MTTTLLLLALIFCGMLVIGHLLGRRLARADQEQLLAFRRILDHYIEQEVQRRLDEQEVCAAVAAKMSAPPTQRDDRCPESQPTVIPMIRPGSGSATG